MGLAQRYWRIGLSALLILGIATLLQRGTIKESFQQSNVIIIDNRDIPKLTYDSGVTAYQFIVQYNLGMPDAVRVGYSPRNFFTSFPNKRQALQYISSYYPTSQILDGGFSPYDMYMVGMNVLPLLKQRGFTVQNLIAQGFSPVTLQEAGYTIPELRAGNLTLEQLKTAGVKPSELYANGVSLPDIYRLGYPTSSLLGPFGINATPAQWRQAGMPAKPLLDAGVSPTALIAAGYLNAEVYPVAAADDPTLRPNVCSALQAQIDYLRRMVQQMRGGVQQINADVNGINAGRDTNFNYQYEVAPNCTRNLTNSCMQLARSDEYIYPIIPGMQATNASVIYSESDIKAEIVKLQNYAQLRSCPTPGLLDYTASRSVGYTDPATLMENLKRISPYYISPVVLSNLSDILLGKMIEKNIQTINGQLLTAERNVNSARAIVASSP